MSHVVGVSPHIIDDARTHTHQGCSVSVTGWTVPSRNQTCFLSPKPLNWDAVHTAAGSVTGSSKLSLPAGRPPPSRTGIMNAWQHSCSLPLPCSASTVTASHLTSVRCSPCSYRHPHVELTTHFHLRLWLIRLIEQTNAKDVVVKF